MGTPILGRFEMLPASFLLVSVAAGAHCAGRESSRGSPPARV